MNYQLPLFDASGNGQLKVQPFRTQLLKWVGSKQRFAHEIISYFPAEFGTYYEPFLGSGAVLGTLSPPKAIASDALKPLMDLWQAIQAYPDTVKVWYAQRWQQYMDGDKVAAYEQIKAAYNAHPTAADLVFLSRSCYGGVVRFRKDGYMSTPCGVHAPILPENFARRVDLWHPRVQHVTFLHSDFETVMQQSQKGDVVYCDPPYSDTQAILYGAQKFSLQRLFKVIADCKRRGVYVVLSIDGTKKTGRKKLFPDIPAGLFEREVSVNCGRSMLKRFQMEGQTLEGEVVTDRLLLTY